MSSIQKDVSSTERKISDLYASSFGERRLLKWMKSRRSDPLWLKVEPWLKGGKALDVGCGLGFDSVILAEHKFEVLGIDISPINIDRSRLMAKISGMSSNCQFRVVDLNYEELPDEQFDLIFGRAVLHHLTVRPLTYTLKSLRKCLRPGGNVVFIEPLDRNPFVVINRRLLDRYDRTPDEKPLNLMKAVESFEDAFPHVLHEEFQLLSPSSQFFSKALRSELMRKYTNRALVQLDGYLMDLFPALRQFAWISLIVAK